MVNSTPNGEVPMIGAQERPYYGSYQQLLDATADRPSGLQVHELQAIAHPCTTDELSPQKNIELYKDAYVQRVYVFLEIMTSGLPAPPENLRERAVAIVDYVCTEGEFEGRRLIEKLITQDHAPSVEVDQAGIGSRKRSTATNEEIATIYRLAFSDTPYIEILYPNFDYFDFEFALSRSLIAEPARDMIEARLDSMQTQMFYTLETIKEQLSVLQAYAVETKTHGLQILILDIVQKAQELADATVANQGPALIEQELVSILKGLSITYQDNDEVLHTLRIITNCGRKIASLADYQESYAVEIMSQRALLGSPPGGDVVIREANMLKSQFSLEVQRSLERNAIGALTANLSEQTALALARTINHPFGEAAKTMSTPDQKAQRITTLIHKAIQTGGIQYQAELIDLLIHLREEYPWIPPQDLFEVATILPEYNSERIQVSMQELETVMSVITRYKTSPNENISPQFLDNVLSRFIWRTTMYSDADPELRAWGISQVPLLLEIVRQFKDDYLFAIRVPKIIEMLDRATYQVESQDIDMIQLSQSFSSLLDETISGPQLMQLRHTLSMSREGRAIQIVSVLLERIEYLLGEL